LKPDSQATKTKLAIVVPEMLPVPPVKGGAVEHWVHEVANRLDTERFDITVISRPSGENILGRIRYVGIPWTRLEKAFYWLKERVSWRNPLRYLAKIQNVMSYGLRLNPQIQAADILIVHNEPNLLLLMRKPKHQQWILHMHNNHLNHALFKWCYQCALQKVDMVICVSAYIQQAAIKTFPQHADKFKVLFNATDTEVFKPYGEIATLTVNTLLQFTQATPYVLYVGRLTQEKGVDVLIQAFQQTLALHPNAKLVITGSSFFEGAVKTTYQQSLQQLAKPIAEHIVFTGFIPHHQLKYLYAAAHVVVVPSVWQDPCPLVVLETMASGTCIVASKVGGVPEVIDHNVNGVLVNPNQVDELATALHDLLQHPDKAQQMAIAARQKMLDGYGWEHLVSKLEHRLMTLARLTSSGTTLSRPEIS
jgi:spore coat protein SA